MKRRLNLACGNRLVDQADGWETIHHDRWRHRPEIDVEWDLEDTPWPWPDEHFDGIIAFDILEHIHRPIRFIEELWRIARHDAQIFIHTCWAGPHPDARAAWRDPTHVRPWHEMSFHYFDPLHGGEWHTNYGAFYSRARFEVLDVRKEPPDNIAFMLRAIKDAEFS